jgi:hypothetical protein
MAACTEHISLDTWASIATAMFTAAIALLTWWLARSTIREGRRSTGLQLFSQMVDSYQAGPMRYLRMRLARQLKGNFDAYTTTSRPVTLRHGVAYQEVDPTVWEFFENLGRLVRAEALDIQISWNYFSDAVLAYWTASSATISAERTRTGESDLFTDFEWLAGKFAARDSEGHRREPPRELAPNRCLEFLRGEAQLGPTEWSYKTANS